MIYTIGGYRVDIFLRVTPTKGGKAAGDELEDGARYTDHFSRDPDALTIEGVVSDDPTIELAEVRVREREGLSEEGLEGGYRPSAFARQRFDQILDDELPVDVVTPLRIYRGFFLESYVAEEHPSVFRFTAQLSQAKLVQLTRELVAIPTATGRKNLGLDPFSKLAKGLKESFKEGLADLAGSPVEIYDERGKAVAHYDVAKGKWFRKDGSEVDPFDPAQARDLRTPEVRLDPKTNRYVDKKGLPITKAPAPIDNPGTRLQRALAKPWWVKTPGGA